MGDDRYDALKRQAKTHFDRKTAALRAQYKKDIESIDNVRRLERVTFSSQSRSNGQVASTGSSRGALVSALSKILPAMVGEFGSDDVLQKLCEFAGTSPVTEHRASVASAMKRFVENGTLEVLVEPRGRRAGRYRARKEENVNGAKSGPPVIPDGPTTDPPG